MGSMRAWWLLCLVATAAAAQEGDGAAGKGTEDPIPALVKELSEGDAAARAKAARLLAGTGSVRAVEPLRVALADPEGAVRGAAAVALVRLDASDERVQKALVVALRCPDWYTRWKACMALRSLGPPAASAVPELLAAAADGDLDITREAAGAALCLAPGDAQAAAGLARILASDLTFDRAAVLHALDKAGQIKVAKEWLATELVTDRHGLRAEAAPLLRKCGVADAVRYSKALENGDPPARATAVYQLVREVDVASEALVDMLGDPEPELRRAAIILLRDRQVFDALPRIAALLLDESPEVRLCAAHTLQSSRKEVPEAGPGLVRLAAAQDSETRTAAFYAMRATGFEALAALLDERTESRADGTTGWMVQLRPSYGSRTVCDNLVALLEDQKHGAALVAALRDTLGPGQDANLIDGLASEYPTTRRTAAVLLGHLALDPGLCIPALEKAAKDEDPDVRDTATAALERLRARR